MTIRIVVVLPAPLPPTKPVSNPAGTSNDTSSTAVFSPNRLVSSRVSSMATTLVTRGLAGIPRGTDQWVEARPAWVSSSAGRMRPAS